ncbi:unnamed protein product, partial [Didymodactylos carnosus]
SQLLLLTGALQNDRVSLLSLGHKHFYGLDNVPFDYDQAYVYYRQMAEISKDEHYQPREKEVRDRVLPLEKYPSSE